MKKWKTIVMTAVLALVISSILPGAIGMSERKMAIARQIGLESTGEHTIRLPFYGWHTVSADNTSSMGVTFDGISSDNPGSGILDVYVNNVSRGDWISVQVSVGYNIFDWRECPHSKYFVKFVVAGLPIGDWINENDTSKGTKIDIFCAIAQFRAYSNTTRTVRAHFGVSSPYGNKELTVKVFIHVTIKKPHTFIDKLLGNVKYLLNTKLASRDFNVHFTMPDVSTSKSIMPKSNVPVAIQPVKSATNPAVKTTNPVIARLFETISEQINSYNSNVETTPSITPNAQPNPSTTPNKDIQVEPSDISNTVSEEQEANNC